MGLGFRNAEVPRTGRVSRELATGEEPVVYGLGFRSWFCNELSDKYFRKVLRCAHMAVSKGGIRFAVCHPAGSSLA